MAGSNRKQDGGYLKGKSHKHGGISAIVGGNTPVELEGGEYIIRKSSVDKLGKGVLEHINKKGRIPTMAKGGKVKYDEGGKAYGIGKWFKSLGDKAMAKKKRKSVLGNKGKDQLTDDADKWTFGEKFTKKGREKWKRRRTSKKAIKTLKGLDADKVTTTIKGPDKIEQTKKALKESGKIKKKDVKGAVVTKGGLYPEYGKKTKSAGKFRDAFKAARKAGKKTFEWQGRKYTSETAEEKKARTTPKATGTKD